MSVLEWQSGFGLAASAADPRPPSFAKVAELADAPA